LSYIAASNLRTMYEPNSKVTISVIQSKKIYKDGDSPILLQITVSKKRHTKVLFKLDSKFWDSKKQKVKSNHLQCQKLNLKINDEISKANEYILDCQRNNTSISIESIFNSKVTRSLSDELLSHSEYLTSLDKHRTAKKYKNTSRKVNLFDPKSTLVLNIEWLDKYTHFCKVLGNAQNTIQKDLEHIKKMIEYGIKTKIITVNPFLEFKLSRTTGTVDKLNLDEVKVLENYEPEDISIKKAKEIWLFSMYHWGLRAYDLIFLKKYDIENGVIKILGTQKSKKIHLIEQSYFPTILGSDNYYFDYIKKEPTDKLEEIKIKDSINTIINYNLKKLAKLSGINKKLTLHTARHTFSYICDDKGMSLNDIASLLGHSSIKTTANYVQSLKKDDILNAKVKNVFQKD
jgi:integrase/recombinase XerD